MEESKDAPATASATSTSGATPPHASTQTCGSVNTGVAVPTSAGAAETLEQVKRLRANVDALAAERKRLRQELIVQQLAMDSAKKAHQDIMSRNGTPLTDEGLEKVLADAKVEHADLEASTLGPDAPLRKYLEASAAHAKAEVELTKTQRQFEEADDKLRDKTKSGGLEYLQDRMREHSGGWQRIEGDGVTAALAYDKACQLESMILEMYAELMEMKKARKAAEHVAWGLPGSTVAGDRVPAANLAHLKAWVQEVKPAATKLRLLYRRSRDGVTVADFHRCCDGKGATVVLCHDAATGCVFGGFASVAWASPSSGNSVAAPGSFLFRLVSGRDGSAAAERTGNILQPDRAVYHNSGCGPDFSSNGELRFNLGGASAKMAKCQLFTSSSPCYELPAGHTTYARFLDDTDSSDHDPKLADVEVWAVE